MCTNTWVEGMAPILPATFRELVKQGETSSSGLVLKFTHRSDAEIVLKLQEKVFLKRATSRNVLLAESLPLQDVLFLGEALPHFASLRFMAIFGSQVGDKGVVSLRHGLQAMSKRIARLSLIECNIGDAGAADLATALQECQDLACLSLRGNSITDAGAAALGRSLSQSGCTRLAKVDLSSNSVSSDGATAFVDALCRLRSFFRVDGPDKLLIFVSDLQYLQSIAWRLEVGWLRCYYGCCGVGSYFCCCNQDCPPANWCWGYVCRFYVCSSRLLRGCLSCLVSCSLRHQCISHTVCRSVKHTQGLGMDENQRLFMDKFGWQSWPSD